LVQVKFAILPRCEGAFRTHLHQDTILTDAP